MMLLAGLLLALTDAHPQDAPQLPALGEFTASDEPQQGGSCPSNAPLLCDNAYCCPQDYPYCCPGQQCGAEPTCGGGGDDTGTDPTGGGGGSCSPEDTACDDGCCPSGSVCGSPGTNTCCPVDAPHHCAAEGTCSPDPTACGGGDEDGSDGGSCPGDASGYPGLPADIQVWSQCAAACSYCGVGNQEGVDATCSILEAWDSSYPSQCSWCSRDCSTPSGDQGDPGSVSTDDDDSASGCSVGRSQTGPWSTALLVVLLGLRRRRAVA